MVMFHEDDERIKAAARAKRGKNPFRHVFRAVLILTALAGLSVIVLANLGGQHQALRMGLEDYLRGATGYTANIGKFEGMYFFPRLSLKAGDVVLSDTNGSEKARIDSVNIAMPFTAMMFSRHALEELDVRGIKAAAGVFTPGDLVISRVSLVDEDAANARAEILGRHGQDDLLFTLSMQRRDRPGMKPLYTLEDVRDVSLRLGNLDISGQVTQAFSSTKMDVRTVKISGSGSELSADLDLEVGLTGRSRMSGTFKDIAGSSGNIDIGYDKKWAEGKVVFDAIQIAEIPFFCRLLDIATALLSISPDKILFAPDFYAAVKFTAPAPADFDLDVTVKGGGVEVSGRGENPCKK